MVQMEPIAKIGPEEAAGEKDLEKNAILDLAPTDMIKRASSSKVIVKSKTGLRATTLFVFRDVDNASDRLIDFNNFCLVNKAMLNKIVKNIYNAGNNNQESAENHQREMSTVSDYIKYMPNLLDFENKRMYFKKEIKKLRRQANARGLPLYIRRRDIFMDAFS